MKAKADSDEAAKYTDYFDFTEPLRRCSSHRLLAMRRGEDEGILRVSISADDEDCIGRLQRNWARGNGPCTTLVEEAVEDGYKRLLKPSIETEFAALSKERADDEAIGVFIVTNALIVLCGITGLFARLMCIIPHSLAAAMLVEYSAKISAICFMHCVIREVVGILLIPTCAKHLGYIECYCLPGASSMDVCMPLVEKATNSTIAVYSFINGVVLSASVPVLVSIFMSI